MQGTETVLRLEDYRRPGEARPSHPRTLQGLRLVEAGKRGGARARWGGGGGARPYERIRGWMGIGAPRQHHRERMLYTSWSEGDIATTLGAILRDEMGVYRESS